jgi:energy-coupling factor transporter ATP-binding protein EcfA2
MKIVNLVADNFKRLSAVEITPEGNVVEITGKNGSGKSSVLDAIYVALVGRSVAPPKPIRNGEEECRIRLDMGELIVTRTFKAKEGAPYTDTLKVENADGLRYGKPQEVLDALLGEIGFDPFGFCQMKPAEQAATLLDMVPLPVDLDELREADESDYLKRRDINRDLVSAKSQLAAIPKEDVPEQLPDRKALVEQLTNAANINGEIERERMKRQIALRNIEGMREAASEKQARAAELRAQAEALESDVVNGLKDAQDAADKLESLEPLGEPVDTEALRQGIEAADRAAAIVQRQHERAQHAARVQQLEAESKELTEAMEKREEQRREALAEAKMPVDGLGFMIDEKGKPLVTFGGVPFEQASTAEQLRASTAIAMAANPQLRVLQIKDGSLLDEDSMKLLGELAKDQDYQLWIERVGTGGVGIVMENGEVKAAPATKPAKATEPKAEGTLV